jgi:hypothetical protein
LRPAVWQKTKWLWLALGLWLSPTAPAWASCDNLAGLAAAQCMIQQQQAGGMLNPGNAGNWQSAVPQFTPDAGLPTDVHNNRGDAGELARRGRAAMDADPNMPALIRGRQDAMAWSLAGSDAVLNAQQALATATPLPGITSQCTDQEVCVRRAAGPPEPYTCIEPAAGLHVCPETRAVITNVRGGVFNPVDNGSHDVSIYCPNHWYPDDRDRHARGRAGTCFIYRVAAYDFSTHPWRFQLCARAWSFHKVIVFSVNEGCAWIAEGETFTNVQLTAQRSLFLRHGSTIQHAVWVSGRTGDGFGEVAFNSSAGHPQTLAFRYTRPSYKLSYETLDGRPAPPCALSVQAPLGCGPPTVACEGGGTQIVNGVAIHVPCQTRIETISCKIEDTCAQYRTSACYTTTITCEQEDSAGRCLWFTKTGSCEGTGACEEMRTVRQCTQCGEPDSLVPFCLDTSTDPNGNMLQAAAFLELVQQFRRDFDPMSQEVFRGTVRRCEYPTDAARGMSVAKSAAIAAGAAALTGGKGLVVVMAGASGGMSGMDSVGQNCCALRVQNEIPTSHIVTNLLMSAGQYTAQYYEDLKKTAEEAIKTAEAALLQAREIREGAETVSKSLDEVGETTAAAHVKDSANAARNHIIEGQRKVDEAREAFDAGKFKDAKKLSSDAAAEAGTAGKQIGTSISSADQALSVKAKIAGGVKSLGISIGVRLATQQLMKAAFGGVCDDDDLLLATERKSGHSVIVGTRCVREVRMGIGTICLRKQQVWCSFNSLFARLVQQQGNGNFGTADSPDCSGFTFAEFAQLRFDQMDFSELYQRIVPWINDRAWQNHGAEQARDMFNASQGGGQ